VRKIIQPRKEETIYIDFEGDNLIKNSTAFPVKIDGSDLTGQKTPETLSVILFKSKEPLTIQEIADKLPGVPMSELEKRVSDMQDKGQICERTPGRYCLV
jgi:hypothetical protein